MSAPILSRPVAAFGAIVLLATPVAAQQTPQQASMPAVARLTIQPDSLVLKAGDTVTIKVTAYDANGNVVSDPSLRIVGPRRALAVSRSGQIKAIAPGRHQLVASSLASGSGTTVTASIPVIVGWPALSRLEIAPAPGRLYAGVTLAHTVKGINPDNSERRGLAAIWRSSDPSVATVDRFGFVTAHKPGAVTISATAEGRTANKQYVIAANPVARIDIGIRETHLRTGDVVHLVATARRANGTPIADAPIRWSYSYTPDDTTQAPGGPGIIDNGLFAANAPGVFELIA
jgi:uncharacterized protein YjdB